MAPAVLILVFVGLFVYTASFSPKDRKDLLLAKASKCGCIQDVANVRLYLADREDTSFHGLHHDLANLQTIMKESLASGRLLVLNSKPRLLLAHNFNIPPSLDNWEDYLSFEKSTFALFGNDDNLICEGSMKDCIVSYNECHEWEKTRTDTNGGEKWWLEEPLKKIDDKVPLFGNDSAKTIVRSYGNARLHVTAPFAVQWQNFTLRFLSEVPNSISRLASDALFWLRMQGDGSRAFCLHIRRGDKLDETGAGFVPGLAESTSIENIFDTLKVVAPVSGSTIYIMTNEWNHDFFVPLKEYYRVYLMSDIPQFQSLIEGCPFPHQHTTITEHRKREEKCETFAMYVIEEYMMKLVPPERRIFTFQSEIPNAWRGVGVMAYLHPRGEWRPHTTRRWCKTLHEPCHYHTNCCSGSCSTINTNLTDVEGVCIKPLPH